MLAATMVTMHQPTYDKLSAKSSPSISRGSSIYDQVSWFTSADDLAHLRNPSPLPITPSTQWTCNKCGCVNAFMKTSALHPLGILRCSICSHVNEGNFGIKGLDRFEFVKGPEYKLSIPPATQRPIRTVFVWICCNPHCGRSHQLCYDSVATSACFVRPTALKKIKALTWFSKSFKASGSSDSRSGPSSLSSTGLGYSGERRIYRAKFEATCHCKHKMCEQCLRGVMHHDDEWVVRVQDALTP
jgi:hypothetical protein